MLISTNRMSYLKKIIFIFYFTAVALTGSAQTTDSVKKNKQHFELSFGQSLLFISNTKLADIRNQASIIVPTNSILFFAEFWPEKKVKIPVFINLPTETKQYIVNGQIINEKASLTFGAGFEFEIFHIKIDERSKLDFEIGPLASVIFDNKNNITLAPIIAGRFRVKRGENFVMYFGLSYSVGINALGLLYGTGTVF
jgi:hypothetical protein